MPYLESDFQSDFTYWDRQERKEGRQKTSAAYELKVVNTERKRRLALSDFEPQQIPKLLEAKHDCVYKKFSDADRSLKPFDAIKICHADAYVVVLFYKPRKPKTFYMIDIDIFLFLMEKKKSVTEEEIKAVANEYTL